MKDLNRRVFSGFMRKIGVMSFIFLMLFLSVLATTQAQAQTFSGQAVGVQSNTTQTATAASGVATTSVLANVRIADTGPLPPSGGTLDTGIVAGGAVTTGVANATFTTGTLRSTTSGGVVNGVPTSSSQSTVNDVMLNINGVTVTALTIQANSQCTCTGTTPTCSGNTVVENLVITSGGITTTFTGSIAPNTTLLSTSTGPVTVLNLTTTTTTTIIGNEQIRSTSPDGTENITVNALHITTTTTVTDSSTGTTTTTTSDIIIAQAHSDINCTAPAITPTAANATIGGRVTTRGGRGIGLVTLRLTGGSLSSPVFAVTSTSGYYKFTDVPAGEGYVVTVYKKRYTFDQPNMFVNLNEDVTNMNFVGNLRK